MRIFNKFKGTKGFLYAYEKLVQFLHMRNKEEVERRAKILTFWSNHGDQATFDAFDTSRRTLFRWKASLTQSKGKLFSLDPKSRAPTSRRMRRIDYRIEEWIISQRKLHPKLGKRKLCILIKPLCLSFKLSPPCESTMGRILSDLKKRGLLPKYQKVSVQCGTGRMHLRSHRRRKKLRRRQGERVVQIDTIVRYIQGVKRYIITGIDSETKYGYAHIYKNHSSASAADFLHRYLSVAPIPAMQTDNGSEFQGNFILAAQSLKITHYHTYPRCPKMNAYIERFNRTVCEESINSYMLLLSFDINKAQMKLEDYLLWYNTVRPHRSLSLLSPVQYILSLLTNECQRG
jgi:transposase InsO family protein